MKKLRFTEVECSLYSHRCSEVTAGPILQTFLLTSLIVFIKYSFVSYCTFYSLITSYILPDKTTSFLELWNKENPFSNSLSIYLRWLNIKSIYFQELLFDPAMLSKQGNLFLCTKCNRQKSHFQLKKIFNRTRKVRYNWKHSPVIFIFLPSFLL